jgi:hypothetical protein
MSINGNTMIPIDTKKVESVNSEYHLVLMNKFQRAHKFILSMKIKNGYGRGYGIYRFYMVI